MTQRHGVPRVTRASQPLRVLMVVGAASGVGGLEASFARIQSELRTATITATALVIGSPGTSAVSVAFLGQHLPTRTAAGWRAVSREIAGYDVVHVHGATAAIWPARVVAAARLRGIPVVVTLHLPSHPLPQHRLRGELRSRARMMARSALLWLSAASIYAPSAAAAAVARRQLRPLPLRVRGLWNGVVDPGTSPVSVDGPLRLVFVGRLADHKRPLEFVSAVESASAAGALVSADIVGDGPLRPQVDAAINASAYRDRFTVHGQSSDPGSIMRGGDLLVLTSMTEGCPLVAMEAAGAGRGVMARAGIEGLAEGWSGAFVAVPDDAGAAGFAARICALADDRDAVVRLGTTARRRYEDGFSAARAAQSLRTAYDAARA